MPQQPYSLSPDFNNWMSGMAANGPNFTPPMGLDRSFMNRAAMLGSGAQGAATTDAMRTAYNDPSLAGALGLTARANARNAAANSYNGMLGNFADNQQDFWNRLMQGNQQQQGGLLEHGGNIGGGFWSSLLGDVMSPVATGIGGQIAQRLPPWLMGMAGA